MEVDATNNRVITIGGNVSNTVARRTVRTVDGCVTAASASHAQGAYFAVLGVRTELLSDT